MKLTDKLARRDHQEIWNEYCGFLELNMEQYMWIQNRLMDEQISLWCESGLGRKILKGKMPSNLKEFREMVPLTDYNDYADVLLQHQVDQLPGTPVTWIETTWEGGKKPVKTAPYTQGMIDTFRRNCIAIALFASSDGYGSFAMGDRCLSGLAPLPFLTGLLGLVVEQEFQFTMMPPSDTDPSMRFSEKSKLGIKQAFGTGLDYVLGMGSVSDYISRQFGRLGSGSGGSSHSFLTLPAIARLARGKWKAHKEKRPLKPSDLFDIKGFVVAGTDNACYKDDLERAWGVRPIELFAGTESTLVGTETWNKRDLYFFPDSCFYEFLPEEYIRRTDRYLPTVTMDQVESDHVYELIVTVFRGGAFARYRTGDMYCCTGVGEIKDHSVLPRFRYLDRVPDVIDIAGFTRITETSIMEVLNLANLPIHDWCASKEFERETGHPYLHMYLELDACAVPNRAISETILRKHLEIYFHYLDNDYESLKKILDMEPLQITFLKNDTFKRYREKTGFSIQRINPDREHVRGLLDIQIEEDYINYR